MKKSKKNKSKIKEQQMEKRKGKQKTNQQHVTVMRLKFNKNDILYKQKKNRWKHTHMTLVLMTNNIDMFI